MSSQKKALAWMSWAIATSFVLFQFFLQAAAGLMAASWKNDFQLTATELGTVSASFFLTYVILQIPVGLAYDRLGIRKVLLMASLVLMAGIFALAASQTYWQAILARMAMGFGSGFGFVGMLYVTATFFPRNQFALLVGIAETSAMMGVALSEVGMAWIISHFGWRPALFASGCISALIVLLVFIFIHDKRHFIQQEKTEHLSIFKSIKKVILNPHIWIASIYGFAMSSIINVFATFWGVPFVKIQYQPISLHTVGSLISMVFIGIGLGGPLIAWLVQKYERRRFFMSLFSFLTLILLITTLFIPRHPLWLLYLLLFALGFFSSGYIQIYAVVKDCVNDSYRGTALSTANMILMSAPLIMQPAIGHALFSGYTYPQALSLIVIIIGLAFILSFFIDRHHIED
jgi:MFS family permease